MSIWYLSLSALDDLTVTENEDGFEFSAPEGTECAAWLGHYDSTAELREEFSTAIIASLIDRIEELERNGSEK
jgi:hypothetical protein